jgi:hypothetical protein
MEIKLKEGEMLIFSASSQLNIKGWGMKSIESPKTG